MRQEEIYGRKERAEKRNKQWELLRVSIAFLKTNKLKWRTRKIEECTQIKEIEKEERRRRNME